MRFKSLKILGVCLTLFVISGFFSHTAKADNVYNTITEYYEYVTYGYATPDNKTFMFNVPLYNRSTNNTDDVANANDVFHDWADYMYSIDNVTYYPIYYVDHLKNRIGDVNTYNQQVISLFGEKAITFNTSEEAKQYIQSVYDKYRIGEWILLRKTTTE